jgi:hypothetical protein
VQLILISHSSLEKFSALKCCIFRSILMLSSYRFLHLLNGMFASGFSGHACASPLAQFGWYINSVTKCKTEHMYEVSCVQKHCVHFAGSRSEHVVLWLVRRNLEAEKCNFGCFVASRGHVSWFRLQGLAAGTVRLFYHNRPCSPSILF